MNFLKGVWSKFKALKMWQKILVVILLLSVIGAFPGTSDSSNINTPITQSQTPSPEPVEKTTLNILDESSVNWNNYAPSVKQSIADLVDAGDCTKLQNEFDIADGNNVAQLNRVGENNADLMSLLYDQMQKLGC